MDDIVAKIIHNRKLYWDGHPEISDADYDQLLILLEQEEPNHTLLQSIESSEIPDSKKIKHKEKLYSLDKIFSNEELGEWMKKVARNDDETFVLQPKYDGMACRWYAKDKLLVTRGQDGIYGENISHLMPIVKIATATNIDFDPTLDIEGELVCSKSEFKKTSLTRSGGEKYKTERNLVCGVSNNDEISPFINKIELTLIPYNTFNYIRNLKNINNDWEQICKEYNENIDYPTDGIVIKLEDGLYSNSLGYTAKFPRGQIALKFPDEIKEAKLLDVIFQMGKRKITPVAIIEPTLLDGVTVSRITLHNAKFCIDNNIKINDTLKIIRSGRVIPKVIGVVQNTNEAERKSISIEVCPACGGEVEYCKPFLLCKSIDCSGSTKKKITYSAAVLKMDEFGGGTIDKLVDTFKISSIIDVLSLDYSDFMQIDGFADVSAQNAVNSINNTLSNPIPDYSVFTCLNIHGIGEGVWKSILIKHYPEDVLDLDYNHLMQIDGIGDERAQLIEDGLNEFSENIQTLLDMLNIQKSKDILGGLPKICFSGRFPHPKAHYAQIAKRKGFDVATNVTKNLKYLVNNGATTSKVSKAKQLGVRVLTEDEFLAL